jgi:hypothetical protein
MPGANYLSRLRRFERLQVSLNRSKPFRLRAFRDFSSLRTHFRYVGLLPAPSAACPKSHVAAVAGPTIIGFHEPEMILGVRP